MSNYKQVEDLEPEPGSIGGAMNQWPRQTINWICRDMRVNNLDDNVAKALIDREIKRLRELSEFADFNGINPENLDRKIDLLEKADTETLISAIEEEYNSKYVSESMLNKCPFEDSGFDKSCWSCPVAGSLFDRLEKELKEKKKA
jgi:hypothetical protein